jgi:ABC-2 type transport system permease protein
MHSLRLIRSFARASVQQELAYHTNFLLTVLNALLNLGTGLAALAVVFQQVETVNGWTFAGTLVLLSVYLILQAIRGLCFSPSLDTLAGLEGAIWTGTFDFTLLRPVNPQLIATFQQWRPLALLDLLLAIGVFAFAMNRMQESLDLLSLLSFVLALAAATTILYSLLLGLASLVFWGPGVLYSWIFDAVFEMARYPVQLYPGWLRLILTWVIPVGLMTTVPAAVFNNSLSTVTLIGSGVAAVALFVAASLLFQAGLRRYNSASS